MNTTRKLSLLVIIVLIALSFSSCLVRHSPYRKWNTRTNRAYYYGRHHNLAGRHRWVGNQYSNTH